MGEVPAGAFEKGVDEVEGHLAPAGEGVGFAPVVLGAHEVVFKAAVGGAGEEASGKIVLMARLAQAVDGGVEMALGEGLSVGLAVAAP